MRSRGLRSQLILTTTTATALALALALGGCATSSDPAVKDVTDGSTGNSELGNQTTDSGDDAVAVSLPATYPLDAVPLIDGVIIEADDAGILWNVVIVPDAPVEAVPDEAEGLLTDRGMERISELGVNRVYSSDEFNVTVNIHDDGTVSYTVLPR